MIARLRLLYGSLLDCWKHGLKDHFRRCTAAFFLLALIFFGLGMCFPEVQNKFFGMVSSAMDNVDAVTEDGSISPMALFANNVSACGFIMIYGFLPFVKLSALALGTNAMVLGTTAVWYVQNDVSLLTLLAGLLPHGLVELPALFLAISMSLYICEHLSRRCRRDKTAYGPWACVVLMARMHVLVLLPLLLVASLLEAYVTPLVMAFFL